MINTKIIILVLILLIVGSFTSTALADDSNPAVPPPLTEWPSDPGPKPERPIYPAIQAWVTALEETTSWKYSDWVQPSWLEDLFVVFQDGENNLLLWFVKAEDGAWQLKMSRENALPKTGLKYELHDLARSSNFFDDSPLGISFQAAYYWALNYEHSMSDYTCTWQKQPDGIWRLTEYHEWDYTPEQDRLTDDATGTFIVFHEDFLTYFTDDTYGIVEKGISASFCLDTNLETVVVDDIPKTPEEARKAAGKE